MSEQHVLLVDDEPGIRETLSLALEQAGYRVSPAATAEDALEVLSREEVKIVLSDIRMPGMGGEALLVPNFTLLGDARKGRRPSFTRAAAPELAEQLIADLIAYVAGMGVKLKTRIALGSQGPFQVH